MYVYNWLGLKLFLFIISPPFLISSRPEHTPMLVPKLSLVYLLMNWKPRDITLTCFDLIHGMSFNRPLFYDASKVRSNFIDELGFYFLKFFFSSSLNFSLFFCYSSFLRLVQRFMFWPTVLFQPLVDSIANYRINYWSYFRLSSLGPISFCKLNPLFMATWCWWW